MFSPTGVHVLVRFIPAAQAEPRMPVIAATADADVNGGMVP